MPVHLEIPDDRANQVGLSFRRAANEFHGAVAREPNAEHAPAWRASAEWFDKIADEVLKAQTGPAMFK